MGRVVVAGILVKRGETETADKDDKEQTIETNSGLVKVKPAYNKCLPNKSDDHLASQTVSD